MSDPNTADQAEQIITVPWSQLHDSPLQYRQTYREATIDEIAATITDTGRIHQPLVVRLRYPNPLFRDTYDPQDGYEIVFGHTRKRAGIKAGLTGGPCVVRVMTDAQVRAAQVAENVARADVHPLEEAQGFRAMLDDDGISADELAATLGKSRSYVYGRLKLLALCPEVRKAVMADEVGTEVGLLIARVGPPKLQQKALAAIKSKAYNLGDGGKRSFRSIRDLLVEKFTLDLKAAIFPPDDYSLLPKAGECELCPKRSGNDPTWDDVTCSDGLRQYSRINSGPNVCTDPECFDAKKNAHLARQAAKLQADGHTVVVGNKARAVLDAYGQIKSPMFVEASKVRDALKKANEGKKAGEKLPMPKTFLVQDPRNGRTVETVARADVPADKVAMPAPPTRRASAYSYPPEDNSAAGQEARAKAQAAEEAQILAERNRRRALLDAVRAHMRTIPRSGDELQMLAVRLIDDSDCYTQELVAGLWGQPIDEAEDLLLDLASNLPGGDLALLMLDLVICRNVDVRSRWDITNEPNELNELASLYGIEATSTPSPAGAGADLAAAGAGAGVSTAPDDADADDDRTQELVDDAAGAAGGGQMVEGGGAAAAVQLDNADGCAAGESDATASTSKDDLFGVHA